MFMKPTSIIFQLIIYNLLKFHQLIMKKPKKSRTKSKTKAIVKSNSKLETLIKNKKYILLGLVIFAAFFLRFYNIHEIGLSDVDEATYMLEASWINGEEFADLEYPLSGSKPLFSFLISVCLDIFGNVDYAGIIVSALFGSLTVIVVFLIGYYTYGYWTGLFASIFLAFNKLHLAYSRNAYSEVLMMFFFSLALLLYIISKKQQDSKSFMIFAGLAIGLSYNSKFLGAFLLGIILLYEIYLIWKKESSIKASIINYSLLMSGFLAVFFMTWFFYYLASQSYLFYFLHRIDQIGIGSYFIENIPFLNEIERYPSEWTTGSNLLFENLVYLFYIYKTFCCILLAFFVVGFIKIFKRRKPYDVLMMMMFILTTLLVIIIAYGRPRTLMFFPIIIALIGAVGLDSLRTWKFKSKRFTKKGSSLIIIIIMLIVTLGGIWKSWDVITYENDAFRKATELIGDDASGTYSTNWQIMEFYTAKDSTNVCESIGDLKENGFSYVVIDTWKLQKYGKDSCFFEIMENYEPIGTFDREIHAWKFPIKELKFLKNVNDRLQSTCIETKVQTLESSFKTQETDHKVYVYEI